MDKWEWLRIGAKLFPCFRKKIVALTQTQNKTIFEQLMCGVVVLDLRVSYASGLFYASHTFCCESYFDIIQQICNYLRINSRASNPIVLLISPDISNQNTMIGHEDDFIRLLLTHLSKYITKHQVLIYYKSIELDLANYDEIISMDDITNIWFNVQDTDSFVAQFDATDFSSCGNNPGLNCVLTPSTNNMNSVCNLPQISIKKYADLIKPVALLLLAERARQKKSLPIYCTFDFVDRKLVRDGKSIG
jgi:hypothetical protein